MTLDQPCSQKTMVVPVTDTQGYCPIRSTALTFKTDTQHPGGISVRQIAFNTGMQLEKLARKMQALLGAGNLSARNMETFAMAVKRGDYDTEVEFAMGAEAVSERLLAFDMALIRYSICSAVAQGADVAGAYRTVGAAYALKVRTMTVEISPDLRSFTHRGRTTA